MAFSLQAEALITALQACCLACEGATCSLGSEARAQALASTTLLSVEAAVLP